MLRLTTAASPVRAPLTMLAVTIIGLTATSSATGQSPTFMKSATRRPACTKEALTRGLHRGGQRGYIDGETFACAGRFAYAGVIIDGNEITVLFRLTRRRWHPVDRARYCENGSVPKRIYPTACLTN